ncbi:MAG TPA: lytic murein transglycosylase [Candidatus Competibacteraceae bacterium]|nr:lytic murein transglycosylase [Candidatus Competibacteraceae bacterium]
MTRAKPLVLAAVLAQLAGCQSSAPLAVRAVAVAAGVTPAASAAPVNAVSFAEWLQQFRAQALAQGIAPATVERALSGLRPNPKVLELDGRQPEFVKPVWEYLDNAVSQARVSQGRRLLLQHQELLRRVAAHFRADPEVLVAIWAMESNYGQSLGGFDVIEALATLGWQGRRQAYGQEQLLAALRILERDDIGRARLRGSWAGAMGQTQFIPTTFLQYAVDFDGDGRRDLWNSLPDVFASTAHYLAQSGWQPGRPWGFEVQVPPGFDWALSDPELRLSLSEWRQRGLRRADGTPLAAGDERAELILPAGHQGPAFLVLDNFRAILRYNNAQSYALAVAQLSEHYRGRGGIVTAWPTWQRPLSRAERLELQQRLDGQGYGLGQADGILGPRTRAAIRQYQRAQGLPADGYASAELLQRLRTVPGRG